MDRRNTELLLLGLATPLVLLLYSMVMVSSGNDLTLRTMAVPLGMMVAFLIAHVGVRFFAPNADSAILPIVYLLSGIGIGFITRLDTSMALRQVMWLFLGVACMILVLILIRNLDKIVEYKYTLGIIGVLLLLSPMLPVVGTEIYGSRIWLSVGSFSFQPGEIAKVCLVLFLAAYLAQNREMLSIFTGKLGPFRTPDMRTLTPLLIMWALSFVVVVFEKDLGSALVVFLLFLTMLYVASGKKFYLIIAFLLAAAGCVVLYVGFSHVQIRVNTWLDPFSDAYDTGYQLCQSIYALAAGGLTGCGIGNGLAENIPVVESDFIFSLISEETGLLGGAAVLLLYISLAVRGMATAARAKSDVSAFVAVGLTATIVFQAFIIVGGVTRLIPLTGITLPFISQGGSSLLASFIAVGFLLRCGDEATGINTEMVDGTSRMAPITIGAKAGSHAKGSHAHAAEPTGVLGRVALGRRLTGTIMVFCALFAVLVANLTYVMVIMADTYESYPGNAHSLYDEANTKRGSIYTSDGVVLAESEEQEDGSYLRVYPEGSLASHVVGYYSTTYGNSGIEDSMNDTLTGSQNYATWMDVINNAAGLRQAGNDVTLTLNSTIQKAAEAALEGYSGAIVVMNPSTGAIYAMASSPTYTNDDLESLMSATDDDSATLVNRATQALYAPGSTFKLVTLAAALENGVATLDTTYDSPGTMDIGNAEVTNYGKYSYGTIDLEEALEVSSNTVYGQLAVDIGADKLVAMAEKFGFGSTIDSLELPLYESLMPDPDEMTTWELAWAGAGQPVGEHESPAGPQATPLQMAMVAAAIANDGTLMTPYLVESIYNSKGEKAFTASPTTLSQVMSKDTAETITEAMEAVVNEGTGYDAAVSGVQVAGKTGTAQTGSDYEDSWFVGFAPADNPQVVIAVVIEDGVNTASGDSAGKASPKFSEVMEAALEELGTTE